MARIARWVSLTLLAVVLVLGAALWLIESPWAREWLEKQASQRLGDRNVEIGALDIGWGWPLSVRLEDVRVANPDWAPHERLLTLQALELVVDTNALLKGDIQLGRLHLQRPAVHLARREDGATSWEGLMDQEDDGEPGMRPDAIRVAEGRLTYAIRCSTPISMSPSIRATPSLASWWPRPRGVFKESPCSSTSRATPQPRRWQAIPWLMPRGFRARWASRTWVRSTVGCRHVSMTAA